MFFFHLASSKSSCFPQSIARHSFFFKNDSFAYAESEDAGQVRVRCIVVSFQMRFCPFFVVATFKNPLYFEAHTFIRIFDLCMQQSTAQP